jgi:uncharacterized DUF497 family protein
VRFDWDEKKNRSNFRKHGVLFETAIEVFDDPNCVLEQDREVDGEARWQALGRVGGVLVLIVAHTIDDEEDEEIVRIFSARTVTKRERRRYEEAH